MAEINGEQAAQKLKSRLAARALARLGLRYVSTDVLTIRRANARARVGPSSQPAAAPSATRSRAHD